MAEFKGAVVIVDDDPGMRNLLSDFLGAESYLSHAYSSAEETLVAIRNRVVEPDVVITDLKLSQMDGLELMCTLKQEFPDLPVVLATGYGSVDTAIEAMKSGAHDYVVKPFKLFELSVVLERAIEKHRLAQDNSALRQEVQKSWGVGNVLGKSAAMKTIFDLVERVSKSATNVLIAGESGTGKEMVARLLHSLGPRAQKPFIAINCSAIPETLLESELFGHAKGSFTGAAQRKKGLFEEANGGTIFLDEIGDMSPPLQAKLLRVIQERKIRAVGDNVLQDVDVRIIAATHKDLKAAIKQNLFREDLYYRLSVIPVTLPPLRKRVEDIPVLAEHFLRKYAAANGANIRGFTKRALAKLMKSRWEGNVRELENVIERAVVLSTGTLLDTNDIPDSEVVSPDLFVKEATSDFPTTSELEARYIRMVLDKTGGRKDKAAEILGMNRRTLYRKVHEYKLLGSEGSEVFEGQEEPGALRQPASNSVATLH